jgi:hypothetical protein
MFQFCSLLHRGKQALNGLSAGACDVTTSALGNHQQYQRLPANALGSAVWLLGDGFRG